MNAPYAFYLAEDPDNTILDSAIDSVRFAAKVCDDPGDGTLRCQSMDAIPDGTLVAFRERMIDGVGYCTDTVFAANQIIRFGRLLDSPGMVRFGERLAEHCFNGGFFDDPKLPVRLYLVLGSNQFLDNLEGHETYIEPGHMARVGHQLLMLSDVVEEGMAARAREAGARIAAWTTTLERCPNGWFPRRSTPDGQVFAHAADAFGPVSLGAALPPDPIYDRSGSGVLILQLLVEAQARGLGDFSAAIARHHRRLHRGRRPFREHQQRHRGPRGERDLRDGLPGAARRGKADGAAGLGRLRLLRVPRATRSLRAGGGPQRAGHERAPVMEDSWNAACTWEIAEAAQAYLVAFGDRGGGRTCTRH